MRALISSLLLIAVFIIPAKAQHVRVQLNFPVGVAVNPPGAAPFAGAVWVGPEWRWQRGRYVHVPGYWCHPKRHHKRWIPGQWRMTRRGYVWIGGRWM